MLDLWGTACWVGVGSTINFALTEHLYKQVTAVPSWTLSVPMLEHCARFVMDRGVDVDALFTNSWSLQDAPAAYALAAEQTAGKGVFIS